jgi:DNA sulfur modification protein DndC
MSARDLSLFEAGARLQMNESIDLTVASMKAHAGEHDHWVFAWSGGKDSTATLTLVLYLIAAGTWPDGWSGDEPHADQWLPVTVYANGAEQHDLFGLEESV